MDKNCLTHMIWVKDVEEWVKEHKHE